MPGRCWTGCEILGKAEFLNPGQSVKDRAALSIIRDAIARGDLRPGRHHRRGHGGQYRDRAGAGRRGDGVRTVIVIPETQSQEKKDMLRLAGARLVEVPAALSRPQQLCPLFRPAGRALARTEPNGAIWANQFDNTANRQAHIDTTAPEIWDQTEGAIDGFICAVGTGGTLAAWPRGCSARASRSAMPIPTARRFILFHHGQARGRGQLDHRRHRPGADHRQSRGACRGHGVPDPRCRGAAGRLRPARR
jgi:cysteine synthase A